MFGLLIGLVAARIAESLDRKLRSTDEAQALVPYPLVGGVVAGAIGNVPVGGDPEEDSAQLDSFRMLRNNVRFLGGKEPPKSILVTSPLPEEGKTTVAVGLAVAAAASGLTTLLLEADLHRPVHAERLSLRPEPGLAEFLRDELPPDDVLQVFEFVDPALQRSAGNGEEPTESVLACLTAGHLGVLSAEVLGSGQFSDLVNTVVGAYDLVIIDSAPLLVVPETLQIVPLVDAVVLCARLGQTTGEQLTSGREVLERLPEKLTTLVVTDLSPDDESHGYTYAYSYRYGPSERSS